MVLLLTMTTYTLHATVHYTVIFTTFPSTIATANTTTPCYPIPPCLVAHSHLGLQVGVGGRPLGGVVPEEGVDVLHQRLCQRRHLRQLQPLQTPEGRKCHLCSPQSTSRPQQHSKLHSHSTTTAEHCRRLKEVSCLCPP